MNRVMQISYTLAMQAITEQYNTLSVQQKADLALGLIYLINMDSIAFCIDAEHLDQHHFFDKFGRKDVALHYKIPDDFRELIKSGLDANYLAICTDRSFECYMAHREDPWYQLGREFC